MAIWPTYERVRMICSALYEMIYASHMNKIFDAIWKERGSRLERQAIPIDMIYS